MSILAELTFRLVLVVVVNIVFDVLDDISINYYHFVQQTHDTSGRMAGGGTFVRFSSARIEHCWFQLLDATLGSSKLNRKFNSLQTLTTEA